MAVDVSAIVFRLDASSGVPTYLQLVQQVEHALRVGELRVGDQLPRVREVVAALAINPNTVLKAYKDLEGRALIEGLPGQGTFVRATLGEVPFATYAGLRRRLQTWLGAARAAGLADSEITALVATALHQRRDEGAA